MTDESAKELAAAMRELTVAINNIRSMFPQSSIMGPTIYHQHSHSYPQPHLGGYPYPQGAYGGAS